MEKRVLAGLITVAVIVLALGFLFLQGQKPAVTAEEKPFSEQKQFLLSPLTGNRYEIVKNPETRELFFVAGDGKKFFSEREVLDAEAKTIPIEEIGLRQKLDSILLEKYGKNPDSGEEVEVTVLVGGKENFDAVKNAITLIGGKIVEENKELKLLAAKVSVSRLDELAQIKEVFSVSSSEVSFGVSQATALDSSVPAGENAWPRAIGLQKWLDAGYRGENSVVAVTDTGVDKQHPSIVQNDAGTERTFFEMAFEGGFDDSVGHGTHVTGIAVGSNESFGGAAKRAIKIQNINAFGSGKASIQDVLLLVAKALELFPVQPSAMNNSWGCDKCPKSRFNGRSLETIFFDSIAEKNKYSVVFAAGNSGETGANSVESPGDAYNVITVGNIDDRETVERTDDRIHFSSAIGPTFDGRKKPDISAPGTNIFSANANWETGSTYISSTGTSISAPIVSGSAAILEDFGLSPLEAKALLLNSAEDRGEAGWDAKYGWGYIDLEKAFNEKENVLTEKIYPKTSFSFLTNVSAGDKITIAWNRHVGESSAVLNDLDLLLYDSSNVLKASSSSRLDNVEQVTANFSGEATIKVVAFDKEFGPEGIQFEEFAIASSKSVATIGIPGFDVSNIQIIGKNAGRIRLRTELLNTGSVALTNISGKMFYPGAGTEYSQEQLIGALNTGETKTVDWSVKIPSTDPPEMSLEAVASFGAEKISLSRKIPTKNSPFQNPKNRYDADKDGFVGPLDALVIINYINYFGAGELDADNPKHTEYYYDVTGDFYVAPSDILAIINYLNDPSSTAQYSIGEAKISGFESNEWHNPGNGYYAFAEQTTASPDTQIVLEKEEKHSDTNPEIVFNVDAQASGAAQVQLVLDNKVVGAIPGSRGEFTINTQTIDAGIHDFKAVAVDSTGKTSEAKAVIASGTREDFARFFSVSSAVAGAGSPAPDIRLAINIESGSVVPPSTRLDAGIVVTNNTPNDFSGKAIIVLKKSTTGEKTSETEKAFSFSPAIGEQSVDFTHEEIALQPLAEYTNYRLEATVYDDTGKMVFSKTVIFGTTGEIQPVPVPELSPLLAIAVAIIAYGLITSRRQH